MARMPGAEWVGEHGSVLMSEASLNKMCVHTIVGLAPAHPAHLSVRSDGHIFQSRDSRYQSDANWYGNDDVIAIECEDMGPAFPPWGGNPKNVPGFTEAQMWSLANIFVWGYETHGIPIIACPDSKDSSEGIAYHRQGIDGNFLAEGYAYPGRVPGGEIWSKYPGKACPGDRRIKQTQEIIIPRARVLAGLEAPKSQGKEDSMYVRNIGPNGQERWAIVSGKMIMGLSANGMKSAREQAEAGRAAATWIDTPEWDAWVKFRNEEGEVLKAVQTNNALLEQLLRTLAPPQQ